MGPEKEDDEYAIAVEGGKTKKKGNAGTQIVESDKDDNNLLQSHQRKFNNYTGIISHTDPS